MPRRREDGFDDFLRRDVPAVGYPTQRGGGGSSEPAPASQASRTKEPAARRTPPERLRNGTVGPRRPVPPPPDAAAARNPMPPGESSPSPVAGVSAAEHERRMRNDPQYRAEVAPAGAPAGAGRVPDRPQGSSRQDSQERPISPSDTGQPPSDPAGPTAPPEGETAGEGISMEGGEPQGSAIVPGQQEAHSGLAQGAPGEGVPLNAIGQPMTAQEQEAQLTQQFQEERGETSTFLSSMEAQEEREKMRRSQPSPVEGVPQGTYERVVAEPQISNAPGGRSMTPGQAAAWKANAEEQLKAYGEYPGRNDPNAPAPPIRPHGRSYNPFTGSFTGESGPNAFKMMGIDMAELEREFYRTGGRGGDN